MARRDDLALRFGYLALLGVTAAVSIVWLVTGALVAAAAHAPSVAAALRARTATGDGWARGLLETVPHSEPLGQAVVDYTFSGLSLLLAGAMLARTPHNWVTRLLAVAMVGSAGAFNLQAHTAAMVVQRVPGLDLGSGPQILLHAVACTVYILALLLFPGTSTGGASLPLPRLGAGVLLAVALGTAVLPHTLTCIMFFGFAVPLAGLVVLPRWIRNGQTAERRAQARLLFSVLLASFGTCIVLAALTGLLWYLRQPGLTLIDPTAHAAGQPTALLFWFSRLSAVGIAAAVLVALRRRQLWSAERAFSRGLASMTVIVLVGGGYTMISALARWLPGTRGGAGEPIAAGLATGLAALLFLPVYLRVERLVDRILYGHRPTPYQALADVVALSRTASGQAPDLAGVAEAIGRALGARWCRLTLRRPGLRDRVYPWSEGTAQDEQDTDQVVLAIRQGGEMIGSIAVDRAAVAGLNRERRGLLDDVADSLGTILQANRLGIELERQLRAALSHAEDIALSRRRAVAEMDSERRMIERDLHDGAQHHLVTLRLALGLVEHEVANGRLDDARKRLDQLNGQLATAEAVLAKTAAGMSSAVLSERGLAAALAADLGSADPPVALIFDDATDERRYPPEVEAAVYFCCLEAVNNARKHAPGAAVAVRLRLEEGELRFRVRDEGPGFDPGANTGSPGRGQRNLLARIRPVGGRIAVESAPGAGTTVHGSVPVPEAALAARTSDRRHTAPPSRAMPPSRPVDPPRFPQRASANAPAPMPAAGTTAPTRAERLGERVEPSASGNGRRSLLTRTRSLIADARQIYSSSPASRRLDELAQWLPTACQVAVLGAADEETSLLVRALRREPFRPGLELYGPDDPAAPRPDARIIVLRGPGHDEATLLERPTSRGGWDTLPTIGVLTPGDEADAEEFDALRRAHQIAEEYQANPEIRRRCQHVIPVAARLALAAAELTEADYGQLRTASGRPPAQPPDEAGPELLARLGRFGVDQALRLIREGTAPSRAALRDGLTQLSGLPRLRQLMISRFVPATEPLRARSVLDELESLARSTGQRSPQVERLLYDLEQLRASSHEFVEVDLVQALRSGTLRLAGSDQQRAEALLGGEGMAASTRLGLAADADSAAIRHAAVQQLAHWQRLSVHPAASSALRNAAQILVRTCEQLLTDGGR